MELWWVLMLHALCIVLTVGVIWMSYAFSAIENTQARRSEVYGILVGVFTTFMFLGCGAALVWLCEADRKEMVSALAMMLAMIMLMHVMVAFTQRVIGTAASKLSLGTLLGGFTLVVYCILSLIIFSNSDLAMFGVARDLKRSVTGHLPIDEWLYVKKPAVLRVLSNALGEHDHAFQYVARRFDELSGRPEIKDVLLIAKDGVSMIEDQDLRVKIMADIIKILADAVVSDVAVLPVRAAPTVPVGGKTESVEDHSDDESGSDGSKSLREIVSRAPSIRSSRASGYAIPDDGSDGVGSVRSSRAPSRGSFHRTVSETGSGSYVSESDGSVSQRPLK